MKNFKVFAFALVAAFAIVSCSNVEKILPKKDGLWQGTSVNTKTYVDDVLDSEETQTDSLGTARYNSDGTGEFFAEDGTSEGTFNWSYNKDNDQVTITQDGIGLVYDVLTSEKNSQTWSTSFSIEFLGVTTRTEVTQSMTRVE